VKFIPPCSLRKFASLTCSARRGKKSRIQDFSHRKRTTMVLANDPPFYSFRFFIIPISTNFYILFKTTGYARDWGSGDQISWDQNRRSKDFAIMKSTKFGIFHKIEIHNNYLISWSQHFSWDQNLLKMLFRVWIRDRSFFWKTVLSKIHSDPPTVGVR